MRGNGRGTPRGCPGADVLARSPKIFLAYSPSLCYTSKLAGGRFRTCNNTIKYTRSLTSGKPWSPQSISDCDRDECMKPGFINGLWEPLLAPERAEDQKGRIRFLANIISMKQ